MDRRHRRLAAPRDAANGRKLFGDICARCHGNRGGGYQEVGSGTGIGRRAFLATSTDGFLRHIIRHGKSATAMRRFSRASATAVANLDAGEVLRLTLGMAAVTLLSIAPYAGSCPVAARLTRGSGVGPGRIFSHDALALLPLALFYHLAHNAMHLLTEGGAVLPLLSDPLGRGQSLFGTATMRVGHLLSDGALGAVQLALALVGHLVALRVAHRIFRRRECGACAGLGPTPTPALRLRLGRPVIDAELCVGRGLCIAACPTRPAALRLVPLGGSA